MHSRSQQLFLGFLYTPSIKLDHLSQHQLKQTVLKHFSLDSDKCIEWVFLLYHLFYSLRKVPESISTQSTSKPPASIATSFSVNILKLNHQLILVLRETITSFTSTVIIPDEKVPTLRDSKVHRHTSTFWPMGGSLRWSYFIVHQNQRRLHLQTIRSKPRKVAEKIVTKT